MILYLMRHGIAEDFAPGAMKGDADRQLTEEGHDKMKQQAAGLKALGLELSLLLASPYARARQTADYAAKALGLSVEITEALVPHAEPDIVMELVAQKAPHGDVMLVGHEPHLSSLGSLILGGRDDLLIDMKKGAVLALQLTRWAWPTRGALAALYPPKSLRKLVRSS